MSTSTAHVWPLQHWAGLTGRIHIKQGPRATLLDEADIVMLLKTVQRNTTGTVRRGGVTLDESQLLDLRATYFPKDDQVSAATADPDDAAHTLEQARQAQAIHALGGPDRAEF